jgi:acyl-coenzyme A synthetase/AMP-(fatty) acid ligase
VVCPLEPGQAPPTLQGSIPDRFVHFKTTSATTGLPRLIAFTSEQLATDAANIVATMGLRPDLPNLGVISLAHSYGFSNLVLPLLLHGVPLILAGAPLPEIVRRAAALAGRDLTLAAVPALWRTWHESGSIPQNVRLAISAGATLPLQLEEAVFQSSGLKIHNFYGSSECGGIAFDAGEKPRTDTACAGSPMQNVTLSIAPDGCLAVSSRAVGETYWPEPNAKLCNGVFHTSDLAELTDHGVYLRGRMTDQINVAGRKISPESIERIVLGHPGVRECVVFGVPSPGAERGEAVVACVAVRDGLTAEPLKQFLLSQLPAWQVPREWWFVESLDANQRGKLSRSEWRKRFLQRPQ